MAHRRRFRSSFRNGSQRRKKTWVQALELSGPGGTLVPLIQPPAITPAVDGYARVVDIFLPGSPSENAIPTESTVLRIRGFVEVGKSVLATGMDQIQAFGICVLDLPNDPGDTDDLPGPMSAPEWDGWMFLRGPTTQSPVDIMGTPYDVKAMRKLDGGQRLCFVSESYSEDGTLDFPVIWYTARVLLALP